jgi:hypothetical protein
MLILIFWIESRLCLKGGYVDGYNSDFSKAVLLRSFPVYTIMTGVIFYL